MQAQAGQQENNRALVTGGMRMGAKGTHSSRTMMLAELTDLLDAVPAEADYPCYAKAVVEENALGKQTAANRRHSLQHLRELYGLDRHLPLFRVLRHLWVADEAGRPLLAILCALARDPLLRCTAPTVLALTPGAELMRSNLLDTIRNAAGSRFNDAVLDKVARNAASSWSQSGHLNGRVRKVRTRVTPTPGALALAIWLGALEGAAGLPLLESRWARVLDRNSHELLSLAFQAHRLGLFHARAGGGAVEIDSAPIDIAAARH